MKQKVLPVTANGSSDKTASVRLAKNINDLIDGLPAGDVVVSISQSIYFHPDGVRMQALVLVETP